MNLNDFEVEVHKYEDVHEASVRNRKGGKTQEVIIPNKPDVYGSRFGTCTCGLTKTKTKPCVHMVAVLKSAQVTSLNTVNIMPSWCYTEVWREQHPNGMAMAAGVNMEALRNGYPNPKVRYCPSIAAPAKGGRPKKMKRQKGPLEGSAKKKKKSTKKSATVKEPAEDDDKESDGNAMNEMEIEAMEIAANLADNGIDEEGNGFECGSA